MAIYNKIYGAVKKLSTGLNFISVIITFAVMLMLMTDIILRNAFKTSILGTYELTEMAMIVVVFCGFAYTQLQKGHVRVDMFVGMMPKKLQAVIDLIIMLITTALCAVMTYCAFGKAAADMARGTATSVLKVPFFPFAYFMAAGMTVFTIVLVFTVVNDIIKFFPKSAAELQE